METMSAWIVSPDCESVIVLLPTCSTICCIAVTVTEPELTVSV